MRALASNDRAALNYVVPESMAHVYVVGVLPIAEADPTTKPQTASQLPDGGWKVGLVTLDSFQVGVCPISCVSGCGGGWFSDGR